MCFIEWNDNLKTNLEEVDKQHQNLVNMLNQLYEAMKQGKGQQVLDKILDELVKYADYHFKTEETYMQKYNYPELSLHKNQHLNFVEKVKEFLDKKSKGQAALSIEVMNFLKNWLVNHIMGTDKKMGQFISSKIK